MVLNIILALAAIGFFFLWLVTSGRRKQSKSEVDNLKNSLRHADALIEELEKYNQDMFQQVNDLNVKVDSMQSRIQGLSKANDEKRELIAELEKKLHGMDVKDEAVELVKKQLDELHLQIKANQEQLDEWRQQKALMENELDEVQLELNSWKNTLEVTRTLSIEEPATRNEELNLDSRDERLVTLISDVVEMVPELEKELASIVWKKVWLPRMQKMCKNVGAWGICGIYRLVRISDGASYVGQAVDIKERWYQHAKKMVGVDDKGGEWVYRGVNRPDEFMWEVLEVVEDRRLLNEKERFWIDAIGELNKS